MAPLYNRSVGLGRASNRRKPVNLNRGMANLAPYSRAPKGTDQLPPLQVAKLTRQLVKAKQGFRSNTDLPGSGLSASGPIQGSVSNNPYLSRIKTLRGRLAGQRPPGQKLEGPTEGGGISRKPGSGPPSGFPAGYSRRPRGRGRFRPGGFGNAGYGRGRPGNPTNGGGSNGLPPGVRYHQQKPTNLAPHQRAIRSYQPLGWLVINNRRYHGQPIGR